MAYNTLQPITSGGTGATTASQARINLGLGPSSDVTFGNLTLAAGGALRTSQSAGNTALLQAYDVDGAAYVTFATLTANNTPTMDLASSVTIGGAAIGNVVGAASSTDTAIVKFNGTGGKTIQNSGVLIDSTDHIVMIAGAVGTPALTFTGDKNTGIFQSANGRVDVSCDGTTYGTFKGVAFAPNDGFTVNDGITGCVLLRNSGGSDSAPSLSYGSDTNTGLYRSAADTQHLVNNGAKTISMDSSNRVTMPVQPSFLAYLASTATDKTGNGASYTLGTDALTEVYDRGNNFNTNGTFTAPVTGLYDLRTQITITGSTIATTFVISIVTTLRTYTYTFNRAAAATDQTVSISCIADMTATNTATVTIVATGEAADTDDIKGGATLETYFCGTLVA